MFGFFTYPAKVGSALMRKGWTPQTLPHSLDPNWGWMIRTLRSNGVSVEDAADWLDGALQGDRTSFEKIDKKAGVFGFMFFGTQQHWDAGENRTFRSGKVIPGRLDHVGVAAPSIERSVAV